LDEVSYLGTIFLLSEETFWEVTAVKNKAKKKHDVRKHKRTKE
jgi:hypothetical protein